MQLDSQGCGVQEFYPKIQALRLLVLPTLQRFRLGRIGRSLQIHVPRCRLESLSPHAFPHSDGNVHPAVLAVQGAELSFDWEAPCSEGKFSNGDVGTWTLNTPVPPWRTRVHLSPWQWSMSHQASCASFFQIQIFSTSTEINCSKTDRCRFSDAWTFTKEKKDPQPTTASSIFSCWPLLLASPGLLWKLL